MNEKPNYEEGFESSVNSEGIETNGANSAT